MPLRLTLPEADPNVGVNGSDAEEETAPGKPPVEDIWVGDVVSQGVVPAMQSLTATTSLVLEKTATAPVIVENRRDQGRANQDACEPCSFLPLSGQDSCQ